MRARHHRFGHKKAGQSIPARSASSGRVGGAVRFVHALTAMVLLVGMIAPYITSTTSAVAAPASTESVGMTLNAQKRNTPPPLPRPNSVVVGGDFQTALGCSDNFDKNCDVTALSPGDDGAWTGSFPIPPGNYSFNVIVRLDSGDVALGENGLAKPDANDNSVNVPDGAVGVYFSYNRYTGEVIAAPYANQLELQTSSGTVLIPPSPNGGWDGYVSVSPGGDNAQLIADGQAFGDPFQIDGGNPGRIHITLGSDGSVQNVEAVEPATLTVYKTDDNGNALTGSCFSVYAGNNVAGQDCDASDGEDGATTINFPNGVSSRADELAESLTPDGQPEADDQSVDLSPGDNQVTVTVSGGGGQEEETETPVEEETPEPTAETTPEGVEVTFVAVDSDTGDTLPGACYNIDGGDELCDDSGSGSVTFDGIEPGDHTVNETRDPDGYQGIGSSDFSVDESGASFNVPHTAIQQAPTTGSFVVHVRDADGNAVPGACFTITPRSGNDGQETSACDGDDGNEDGDVTFSDVTAGRWRLSQNTVPDGYTGADDQNITVPEGDTGEETVTNESVAAALGVIAATTIDENGNELPGVCYDLSGFGQHCDGDDEDSVMTQDGVPADSYDISVIVPDGYELVGDQTQHITVGEGETVNVQFQVQSIQPTEEPTQEAEPTEEPTQEAQPTEEPT
jgi:hypothetical protein